MTKNEMLAKIREIQARDGVEFTDGETIRFIQTCLLFGTRWRAVSEGVATVILMDRDSSGKHR